MTGIDGSILVVGGGPAGSVAATLLARAGHPTVLVDRAAFPRPKPCGECLNPGAVAALERLGLLEAVLEREPARLEGWSVRWPEEAARARREPGGQGPGGGGLRGLLPAPGGLGLSRGELDHALVESARRAGARVLEKVSVETVAPGDPAAGGDLPRVRARDAQGCRFETRPLYVVGADGLRSRIASGLRLVRRGTGPSKASLTWRLECPASEGQALGQLYLAHAGTLGLAPVDAAATRWNATLVVKGQGRRRRLARQGGVMLREWLAAAPTPWNGASRVVDGPWGSGPFHRPVAEAGTGRVLLAGDAAGYYDPLTGQGIYRALRSAELTAAALARALERPAEAAAAVTAYRRQLARAFAPGRRLQRWIEATLGRNPARRVVLGGLARRGGRLDPLVAVTGDARPARSMLLPDSLLVLTGWNDPPAP